MPSVRASFFMPGCQPDLPRRKNCFRRAHDVWRKTGVLLFICLGALVTMPVGAVILWNDPGTTLVHENGAGRDILGGAVKRDDSANDTLYFKFHVDPLSDKDTEEYYAGFELFEGDAERLGIGNSLKAWAYSAFFHADQGGESNNPTGYIDLHTSKPESATSASYQFPRRGAGVTIVFKIQYVPGEDDLVTVWLNPDLGPGANEAYQPDSLTTRFNANASFDEIRLRHSGGGGGWIFSDLAIATSFSDFVDVSSSRPNDGNSGAIGGSRAFDFQSWQKEQGLTQRDVRALAQSREGYIWIGGDDGLTRFDGERFVSFGIAEGIKCGPVSALLEDSRGDLWIGNNDGGLICWHDNQISRFGKETGLPANSITALAEDPSGQIWAGTKAGLAVRQSGSFNALTGAEQFHGRTISALFKDSKGTMWASVKGLGVFQYTNNTFIPPSEDSVGDVLKDADCLLVDREGRLWIGAGEDFVLCHEGNHWHRYRTPPNHARSHVNALAEESDGTIWAGLGPAGLLQFKDGKSILVPAGTGLAGNSVQTLLSDREGRLWAGTDTGLNRLQRRSLFALGQSEGLGFGATESLVEPTPGVVWAGKPNDGIYRWDGKSFSRLSADGLSPHVLEVAAMLVTRDGFCWVATTDKLLLYKDPIAAADEVEEVEVAPKNITTLAEDGQGALWIGTHAGELSALFKNHLMVPRDFHQTNTISSLMADTDGSMWIGTDGNGLYHYANGNFQHIGPGEGLAGNSVRSLYLDAQRTLWIGTADEGLSRWRHGQITNFGVQQGLPDNSVLEILDDDAGRLWLGTSRGIACMNKQQLEDLAAGRTSVVYPKLFGKEDGMSPEECSGTALKTKSGLLWFSSSKGVIVADPHVLPAVTLPPNTVLEEVLVDGSPVPLPQSNDINPVRENDAATNEAPEAKQLRITPGRHQVEFHFTGLSFDAPDQMRFRYQLEGLDTTWVDAGTRRTAFYSYLPPGSYKFRVAACNRDGNWSENDPALGLTVLRHFWQTWWFIALVILSPMFVVGGIVRAVEKRKHLRRLKQLEQERALESERARIARDLHDEMGAKLCRISFLSEHARRGELPPEELKEQITSISDASREVLHSLDEIVWAVNPQNDTLEHLASYIGQYAQDYFQMTGIQCELDIPPELPAYPLSSQQRHHLFLATHEALTNILKHSGATAAQVKMRSNGDAFEIEISDNGKGFEWHGPGSNLSPNPSGDGLSNMARRLTDIGGSCTINSAPDGGTDIKFVFFLKTLSKNNSIKI